VVGLIDDVPTCRELVERMVADAEACIRGRLRGMLVAGPVRPSRL
jgi:nitronate monooxygenase